MPVPTGSLLYRGGWLATPTTAVLEPPDGELGALLEGWAEHRIGGWTVRSDETFAVTRGRSGDAEVLIVGLAMDVTAPGRDEQAVADGLAAALAVSLERFYEAIDDLSGSHVLFVRTGSRLRVIQDATGMETVAYDHGGREPLLASHPALVAELRRRPRSAQAERWLADQPSMAAGFYFPGLLTLYEHVRILTPNTELHPDDGTVQRFWPRGRLARRPVDEIVETVAPWLRNQFEWLRARHPLTVSLTSGVDSRLTLAASRDAAPDIGYWTHVMWGKASHRRDAEIAAQLAARLGLRHEVYRFTRGEPVAPEVRRAWERMHGGEPGAGALQLGLLDRYPAGHLHVRSNVLETVRGFYLKRLPFRPDVVTALSLGAAFGTWRMLEFRRAFAEFCDVTDFSWRSKRNIHWTDLFYWEHRMGSWHSRVVRNLKISHNTHVVYNCRRLLATMLGRPMRDRVGNTVVYELVRHLWPEALDVPVAVLGKLVSPPGR